MSERITEGVTGFTVTGGHIQLEIPKHEQIRRETLKRDILLQVDPNPVKLDTLCEQLMDAMTVEQLGGFLYRAKLANKKRKPTELVGSESQPVVWKYGKRLWLEDDGALHDPDHDYLEDAFLRLTGKHYEVENAEAFEDCGDAMLYDFGDWIVCSSYPGNSAIYEKGE